MTRIHRFEARFVTSVPAQLEDGVLYVSIEHTTALHLCACGCGREVVTPLDPGKWSITFDGATVSLRPSIGNWRFPCRSHYWIEAGGQVAWARSWSDEEVALARAGETPVRRGGMLPSVCQQVVSRLLRLARRWLR